MLLVACQLLVVVFLAEGAVRVIAKKHRGLRMVLNTSADTADFSDVKTLHELMDRSMLGFNPYSVEYGFVMNSRSFRTAEYSPGGAPNHFRVVALGDSFTFASGGLPHEDHWTTVTEYELGPRLERPVEVLRLGVPGTGPAFQLRLWELEAAGLEPDVVVVGFFVGNDFVDHQDDQGSFGGERQGFGGRVAAKSALVRAIRNLIRIEGSEAVDPQGSGEGHSGSPATAGHSVPDYRRSFDPDQPTFEYERFVEIETRRMSLCLNSEKEAFSELAGRVISVVSELASKIETGGSRCIVMVIPDQYQVDMDLVDEILRTTGGRAEDYDLGRPQRTLVAALEAAGVEVLDLLPVFRSTGEGAGLYRPRDTHWNRRGNVVAAVALADRIAPGIGALIFSDGLEAGDTRAWRLSDR